MVLSKLIYNAFKFIIQPAHELDICVPEHILGFPGFSQGIQRVINGGCHILSLKLIHPWQPFSQTDMDKIHTHLKIHSHYFIIICKIPLIGIRYLPFDNHSGSSCCIIIFLYKFADFFRISVDTVEINTFLPPAVQFDKIITEVLNFFVFQHISISPSISAYLISVHDKFYSNFIK